MAKKIYPKSEVTCSKCGKFCTNPQGLGAHMRNVHGHESPNPRVRPKRTPKRTPEGADVMREVIESQMALILKLIEGRP